MIPAGERQSGKTLCSTTPFTCSSTTTTTTVAPSAFPHTLPFHHHRIHPNHHMQHDHRDHLHYCHTPPDFAKQHQQLHPPTIH